MLGIVLRHSKFEKPEVFQLLDQLSAADCDGLELLLWSIWVQHGWSVGL